MIENKIIQFAEWLSTKILPSTMIKYMIYALIIALILSMFICKWIIIFTIVVSHLLYLTIEFLYAKKIESENDEESY